MSQLKEIVKSKIRNLIHVWGIFIKPLKDDEVQFRLMTTFKISVIPFITMGVLAFYLGNVLKMNLIFFEANGFSQLAELRGAYYDYITSTLFDIIPYIAGMFVLIVFLGLYLSDMILRPFRIIGDYCEKKANNEEIEYDPEFFSDLKLLMGFTELFFNVMSSSLKVGKFLPVAVPNKFSKIHKPVFEQIFFIQFTFFLVITSIGLALAIYALTADVYDHMIKLSIETIKSNKSTLYFLKFQADLIQEVAYTVMAAHCMAYFILAFHLYNKVATPAFGIFATMRAFMKGNHSSRVHLIGFNYVRPQSRKINNYLDQLQVFFLESQHEKKKQVHSINKSMKNGS